MNPTLLIPTLCSVLLLTVFAFLFASKMAPMFLLITSTILLILSYSVHRSQFQSDYRNSTWQEALRPFAPFVIVGLVIMLGVGFMYMNKSEDVAAVAPNAARNVAPALNRKSLGGRR